MSLAAVSKYNLPTKNYLILKLFRVSLDYMITVAQFLTQSNRNECIPFSARPKGSEIRILQVFKMKTAQEIERYVKHILPTTDDGKFTSSQIESYWVSIARLYHQIHCDNEAVRYLEEYLAIRPWDREVRLPICPLKFPPRELLIDY